MGRVYGGRACAHQGERRRQGNNQGTSLVEAMTQLEISLHLESLRQAPAAPAAGGKATGAGASELPNWQDDNACAACGQTRLTFEPPSVYCTSCAQRIKRSQARHPCPEPYPVLYPTRKPGRALCCYCPRMRRRCPMGDQPCPLQGSAGRAPAAPPVMDVQTPAPVKASESTAPPRRQQRWW